MSTTGAGGGPDHVGPDELTRYAIGTTALPTSGDFHRPHHGDRSPDKVIRHSARRARDPSGERAGAVRRRTRSGGPRRWDVILQRKPCENLFKS
jgi:hypothetical protein